MRQVNLEEIRKKAEDVLKAYVLLPESISKKNGCMGGYLTVKNADGGTIEAIYRIGFVPYQKDEEKCLVASLEVANQLFETRKTEIKKLTSWNNKNETRKYVGTAVFFDTCDAYERHILSFAGLPELANEACMFILKALMSQSKETTALVASTIKHLVYFENTERPGQEIFNALAEYFEIKM